MHLRTLTDTHQCALAALLLLNSLSPPYPAITYDLSVTQRSHKLSIPCPWVRIARLLNFVHAFLRNTRYVQGVWVWGGNSVCVIVCLCGVRCMCVSVSVFLCVCMCVRESVSRSPAAVAHPVTMHSLAHNRPHPHPTSIQHSCNVQARRAS